MFIHKKLNFVQPCGALGITMITMTMEHTAEAAVRSGWLMLSVLDVKQTLSSVNMQDYEITTVVLGYKTSRYHVFIRQTMN